MDSCLCGPISESSCFDKISFRSLSVKKKKKKKISRLLDRKREDFFRSPLSPSRRRREEGEEEQKGEDLSLPRNFAGRYRIFFGFLENPNHPNGAGERIIGESAARFQRNLFLISPPIFANVSRFSRLPIHLSLLGSFSEDLYCLDYARLLLNLGWM